nr:immunoglobulin light chain junction region [Macaca mulatta]MOV78141.1 immunoglobulin light chain junction region [Macaca mulatta]MOV86348.1 immunoglobulin light chain junction region [Macaca mulatta]
CIQALQFPWTF